MNTEDKIKKIISKSCGIPIGDIALDSSLINDLGADSMNIMEIIVEIEDDFQIAIPEHLIPKINTVRQLIKRIENVNTTI